MMDRDGAKFYRSRHAQEINASNRAGDDLTRRLHWEMAQRYAFLADEAEQGLLSDGDGSSLASGSGAF